MVSVKPIKYLTKKELAPLKLLSFDCDGVSVPEGTEIVVDGNLLKIKTHPITSSMLKKLNLLKKRFYLNFSSGRSLLHLTQMYYPILWDKVTLQAENGIFTLKDGLVIQHGQFTLGELEKIREITAALRNLAKTDRNIEGFEPKQFLITVHCRVPDEKITKTVKKIDDRKNFYIYWSGEAYDICPKRFSKGSGLKNLGEILGISGREMMAVGNDPNDLLMFKYAGLRVTTDPKVIRGDYFTDGRVEPAGEEVVDKIIELMG